jgi:hypothetical protein
MWRTLKSLLKFPATRGTLVFQQALCLVFLLLGCPLLRADMSSVPLGSTIRGFVMPQRNEQGEMQANITGDTATAVSVNRTTITGLKIELYDGKEVGTTITSPKSDLWNEENRLSTRSGVLIKRENMTITAQTMEWELKEQRAVLRQQVRVVIDKLDFGAKPKDETKPESLQ